MAKNCTECGQSLVNGNCVNRNCSLAVEDKYGSLVPDEIVSMDPTQIVDYTGTLGIAPMDADSVFPSESMDPDADSAQTRMVDDDFYKQIQEFFPAEDSSSKSSEPVVESGSGEGPDASRSINLQGVRNEFVIEEFVPPVRDIRFPSDTASLEEIRALDPADVEGDEYKIVEKLGEGGYGVVFEAEQVALNRPVAVKVLKPKRKKSGSRAPGRSGTGTGELQRRRDQFLHEAKITARLQHPNIVPLYDFGINTQGQLFYSMKKVERRPWSSIILNTAKLLEVHEDDVDARSDREAINRNVEIFDRVCDAMAYSHAKQVIHRDLKPDNIMIGDYGEVLLIDFGMALDFSAGQPEFSAGGTLVYMAPEMAEHFAKQKEIQLTAQQTAQKLGIDKGSIFLDQSNLLGIGKLAKELIQQSKDEGVVELAETLIRLDSEEKALAAKISYAADIYLLGAILYQVAVGHPPHYFPIAACKQGRKEKFQKELWLALRNGFQQYQEVTDPLRISLRNIAVKAMRTEPANRFQSVEELQEAIKGFQLEVQSLEMTETGKEELEKSKGGQGYQHLLPALESFRGAGNLWPESQEAQELQVATACEYASRANNQRDFDAGLSILDEYVLSDHQATEPVVEVRKKLIDGKRRRARNRKLAWASSLAAVIIPLGTFLFFSAKSAQVITDLADAEKAKSAAIVERDNAKLEAANAQAEAKKEVDAEKERTRLEIAANEKAAAEQIAEQKRIAQEQVEETKRVSEEEVAEAKRVAAENIKREKMMSELEIAQAKETAEAEVAAARLQAMKDKAAALAESAAAKAEAAKYAFDAELGAYTSNVLTIPLDLRTGKLTEAASKLEQLEREANPALKNGWDVSYFAKRANVDGVDENLGESTTVADIAAIPGSTESVIVGTENGQTVAWKMTQEGATSKLNLEMPTAGDVADISVSSDGKWLAVAVNNLELIDNKSADFVWVVSLESGKRIPLAESDAVVGCTVVEFSDDANGLKLVSVEELSGYRGVQQRVQVVTRSLESGVIGKGSATPVGATTRDLGRVRYLATARWNSGQPEVAIAYQSLNELDRSDNQRLETLTSTTAGEFVSSKMEIQDFPTAIHLGLNQQLYCGYADGSVDRFDATNLQETPNASNNFNESEIVSLASTADGRLISGSVTGLIIRNPDHSYHKTIQGQLDQLSALSIGHPDPVNGFTMLSGDRNGNVRLWEPETSKHEASVRKDSSVTVTCGAIDVGLTDVAVPAAAFGTADGNVFYFDQQAMRDRNGGTQIGDSAASANATFRFKSPFESFGNAFNDFDSMGIVGDHFVLLKDDGTFFQNYIDESRPAASPRSRSERLTTREIVFGNFIPLLASVHNKDYFFSTDPEKDDRLLFWKKTGASFAHQSVELPTKSLGRIKRLKMSPDGNWLAVVRQQGRNRLAGLYIAEMYDVSSGTSNIRLAGPTDVFQVGDPAFIGFSPDSREMILHFHKRAPDRETWVEHWALAGQKWVQSEEKQKLADRKVDLIDWDRRAEAERMITKANKEFFLVRPEQATYVSKSFGNDSNAIREKLRSVYPTGAADNFYVLGSDSLDLYQGTSSVKSASFSGEIQPLEDARELRVFGERAVVLDKHGFHLIDADLEYVTKLAARKIAVKSLSLSTGRLAILYSNNLCRIWDVRGEQPKGLGKIENASSVELSPDGQWAVCKQGDTLQIFAIGSEFEQPKMSIPVSDVACSWTSDADSKLLIAVHADGKVDWKEVDPSTGNVAPPAVDLPTAFDGIVNFALSPRTRNYIAIQSTTGMSLWALTPQGPLQLNKQDHQFDQSKLQNVKAVSFSEFKADDPQDIGTRLVILASGPGESKAEPRIYLLANDGAKAEEVGRYRVVEIEGAFESKEGKLDLIDCRFSGDGRSLLHVDEKGISVLLGN